MQAPLWFELIRRAPAAYTRNLLSGLTSLPQLDRDRC
jgi:hypothetical protein